MSLMTLIGPYENRGYVGRKRLNGQGLLSYFVPYVPYKVL